MTRRFGFYYSLFGVLILIVLAVLVLVRLNAVRSANLQEATASYRRLQDIVRRELASGGDVAPAIREYAGQVPQALAVLIYRPESGIRYLWTTDARLLGFPESAFRALREFPVYRLNELSQYRLREQIRLPSGDAHYLDAIYRVLSFQDAYPALRDSLITLLVFAFLTAVLALTLLPRTQTAVGAPGRPPAPRPPRTDEAAAVVDAVPETHAAGAEPAFEEVELEEIAADPGEPGTLFSPVTGLSYRNHLERRLGLELERAAYNDQDLSCMLIRYPEIQTGSEQYVERAREVLSSFQFEDLCFEFDRTAFCVILPNTDLNQAIRQAEKFQGSHAGRILVGLSSRNGRLVEGARVLAEAARSLEHAAHEKGGIVGFRPDPRKYRQYLSGRSGQQG